MTDKNESLSDTIQPKSDQLNADDLLVAPKTVLITAVTRGNAEQPVNVALEGLRPYRPCKSMRRVMIHAWGDRGSDWVGKSMTLYCDPSVKFGGVAVGGIRISHMSDIPGPLTLMLTTTRSKRAGYTVHPLAMDTYPAALFEEKLPAMRQMIADGKMTIEQVIAHCEKTGRLTENMKAQIAQPA